MKEDDLPGHESCATPRKHSPPHYPAVELVELADKIAVETWKQIVDYADNCEDGIQDLDGDTNCIRFIKNAIEKAAVKGIVVVKQDVTISDFVESAVNVRFVRADPKWTMRLERGQIILERDVK